MREVTVTLDLSVKSVEVTSIQPLEEDGTFGVKEVTVTSDKIGPEADVAESSVTVPLDLKSADVTVSTGVKSADVTIPYTFPDTSFKFVVDTRNLVYAGYNYTDRLGVIKNHDPLTHRSIRNIWHASAVPYIGAPQISSDSNQYTLPTIENGVYSFTVDWGDGTSSGNISSWDDDAITHTYAEGGEYEININGVFRGINFSRNTAKDHTDCAKLIEIKNWGSLSRLSISSDANVFAKTTDGYTYAGSDASRTSGVFDGCINWKGGTSEPPNWWNDAASKVLQGSNMQNTFSGCNAWDGFDMRSWGTPTSPISGSLYGQFNNRCPDPDKSDVNANFHFVGDGGYLGFSQSLTRNADNTAQFQNTSTNFEVSNWTLTGSMQSLFSNLTEFNPNVTNLVTSAITNLTSTFNSCKKFTGEGVSTWDVSGVKSTTHNGVGFYQLFGNTDEFNQSLAHFVFTADDARISEMLVRAKKFNRDCSSWDTSKVRYANGLFNEASLFNNGAQPWTDADWTNLGTGTGGGCANMFRKTNFNQDVSNWKFPTAQEFSASGMFAACPFNQPVETREGQYWNMEMCNSMNSMFSGNQVFNRDLSSWDTGRVTNMAYMFEGALLFSRDLDTWNTASVTSMNSMFKNARVFNSRVDGWDTSSVTDFSRMFQGAHLFNDDGVSGWDTSSATNMEYLFDTAYDFNQPVNSWDTSSVTDLRGCFRNADDFDQDLSNWDVSSVTNFGQMFYSANSFNGDVSTWTINTTPGSNISMGGMFYRMPHLFDGNVSGGDLSGWDTSEVTNMSQMFYDASAGHRLVHGDDVLTQTHGNAKFFPNWSPGVGGWDTGKVTNMSNMFFTAGTFNDDISGWDVSSVTDFGRFVKSCFEFNQNLGGWSLNTSEDVSCHEMFMNCIAFNNGGSATIDNWDTSRVTDMNEMFRGCHSFNQPLNSWDTSNVTDMNQMLRGCSVFNQPLDNWDLSNVTFIGDMFRDTNMSKVNMDTTLLAWCTDPNTPSNLNLGTIPISFAEGLNDDTVDAILAKNWTVFYELGNLVE